MNISKLIDAKCRSATTMLIMLHVTKLKLDFEQYGKTDADPDTKHARHPILPSILQPTIFTPTHTRMSNKCPPTIKLLRLLRNAQRRIDCTCILCVTLATVTVTDTIRMCGNGDCIVISTMLCIWLINATLRSIPTKRNGFLRR